MHERGMSFLQRFMLFQDSGVLQLRNMMKRLQEINSKKPEYLMELSSGRHFVE